MRSTAWAASAAALGLVAGLSALSIGSPAEFATGGPFVSAAEAMIGRPLTPLSYAGVARRTTRRAVVGGAYVGAAVAPGVVVVAPTPACAQVVDAYGRLYWRCP